MLARMCTAIYGAKFELARCANAHTRDRLGWENNAAKKKKNNHHTFDHSANIANALMVFAMW